MSSVVLDAMLQEITMCVFPLFGFTDGYTIVITRGENEDQAMCYACRDNGVFKRGVTVYSLDHLPIDAAKLYNTNHDSDWLHRAPVWVQKQEREEAVNLGSTLVLNQALSVLKM